MTDSDRLALEDTLFLLTRAELRSFAASHREETFYGFAFTCVGIYGEVSLNLNTEGHLAESARREAEKPLSDLHAEEMIRFIIELHRGPSFEDVLKEDELLKEHMSRLPAFTPEFLAERSRWSPDGWKYAGFERDEFRTAWAPHADAVLEARHDDPDWTSEDSATVRRFLKSVCRVLLRLEREGVFDGLARTENFKCFVCDRRDTVEEAWERLAAVRGEPG